MISTPPASWIGVRAIPNRSPASAIVQIGSTVLIRAAWAAPTRWAPA